MGIDFFGYNGIILLEFTELFVKMKRLGR